MPHAVRPHFAYPCLQDVVVLNGQEANMRKNGLSGRDYNLFARGDAGVKALHKWLRQAK